MDVLIPILYIVAFSLFIYGLMGLTGPKTAVRGNWIAAVGMTIAVAATLVQVRHNWVLIIVGLVVGAALGVPSARQVKDDRDAAAGALFNGVGGGTVALIAYAEFLDSDGFTAFAHGESPTVHIVIASLFAAIIGVDLLLGFGDRVPQAAGNPARPPIGIGRLQQPLNACC
jgi:NAD(P) transhydrogenase subunit beta